MSKFLRTCKVGCDFKSCVHILGRAGKVTIQANQTLYKGLKYFEFCCRDVFSRWNVPKAVVYYCVGSLNKLYDFIHYFQNQWKIGRSDIIGYLNVFAHFLDFRRAFSHSASDNVSVFLASEIYLQRAKRFLSEKMKLHQNEVLKVDYLKGINCWAALADLQKVILFYANSYKQTILTSITPSSCIAPHDFDLQYLFFF